MFITVRALPVAGATHRFRAGRAWPSSAVTVEVTERADPQSPHVQVTPAQLEQLRADPHISVFTQVAGGTVGEDLGSVKAQLIEALREREELRRHNARLSEDAEAAGRAATEGSRRIESLQLQVQQLEERLQAALNAPIASAASEPPPKRQR